MIQSSKNTNFSLKMGHLGPNLATPMTTFHFGPTPKLFLWSLQTLLLTQKVAKKGLRTF